MKKRNEPFRLENELNFNKKTYQHFFCKNCHKNSHVKFDSFSSRNSSFIIPLKKLNLLLMGVLYKLFI